MLLRNDMQSEQHLSLLDRFSHIDYPDNLTKRDKELVLEQCDIQGDLYDEAIQNFALAYADAKIFSSNPENLKNLTEEILENLILKWAEQIEPKHNAPKRNTGKGYRDTPVVFSSGKEAINWQGVERRVQMLCKFATTLFDIDDPSRISPEELYKEFEEVHPFEDGNGRVGDLLWKLAITRETGIWPETLSPDLFGEDRTMLDESQ
jgi:Fic family protein